MTSWHAYLNGWLLLLCSCLWFPLVFAEDENQEFEVFGIEFVKIEPATLPVSFWENEPLKLLTSEHPAKDSEKKAITVPKSFWISKYETRVKDWDKIKGNYRWWCNKNNRERKHFSEDLPVTDVTREESIAFCQALDIKISLLDRAKRESMRNFRPNYTFRLPTESEWEIACRAGTTSKFHFGDQITPKEANFGPFQFPENQFSPQQQPILRPVASYQPNAFGLFDMHGNIAEWCLDYIAGDYGATQYPLRNDISKLRPPANSMFTVKGGSFIDKGYRCQSAFVTIGMAKTNYPHVGFRVVYGLRLNDSKPKLPTINTN